MGNGGSAPRFFMCALRGGGVVSLAVRSLYSQLEGRSTHYVGCWVFVLNHWRYIYSDIGTVLMYGGWRFCSTLFLICAVGGVVSLAIRLLYPQLEGPSTQFVGCWVFVLNHWRFKSVAAKVAIHKFRSFISIQPLGRF